MWWHLLYSIISYNLIGLIDSEYNYGMREKIFNKTIDYNHIKEWKWIINDYVNKRRRKLSNNPNGFFNMDYIDQIDYSGAHRSGWQYYPCITFWQNNRKRGYIACLGLSNVSQDLQAKSST